MEGEILSGANATLIPIIIAVISLAKSVFEDFFKSSLGQRLLPVIPVILGMLGGLLGMTAAVGIKAQLISGFITGISASFLFKMGKTTVLGQGVVGKEEKVKPSVESEIKEEEVK